MKKGLWGPFLAAGMGVVLYAGAETKTESDRPGVEATTVITSDRLLFDYKKKFALFEDHVVVTDPQLRLTSDKLTVIFNDDGSASSIRAKGRVTIQQKEITAVSQRASYDVESGKIVLEGNPRVIRGKDVLEGKIITFWRNQNKMICEPNARLLIYPQEGAAQGKLLGEP